MRSSRDGVPLVSFPLRVGLKENQQEKGQPPVFGGPILTHSLVSLSEWVCLRMCDALLDGFKGNEKETKQLGPHFEAHMILLVELYKGKSMKPKRAQKKNDSTSLAMTTHQNKTMIFGGQKQKQISGKKAPGA